MIRSRRSTAPTLAVLMLAGLVGCSTPQPAPKATPYVAQDAGAAAAQPPAAAGGSFAWTPAMDDTARRLRSALGGNASVTQTTDQRLWLSLPVEATFARGRSAVKPAAAANLDQIALALRGHPRAQAQVMGDGDAPGAGASALALDRAASARDWIVGRGVLASRIGVASRNVRGATAEPRLDILIGERSRAGGSSSGAD